MSGWGETTKKWKWVPDGPDEEVPRGQIRRRATYEGVLSASKGTASAKVTFSMSNAQSPNIPAVTADDSKTVSDDFYAALEYLNAVQEGTDWVVSATTRITVKSEAVAEGAYMSMGTSGNSTNKLNQIALQGFTCVPEAPSGGPLP